MSDKMKQIIDSDTFHYLYERWQDEQEYEDINDYSKVIAEKFGVTVVSANESPFGFIVEDAGRRFELRMLEKADHVVGAYRPAK